MDVKKIALLVVALIIAGITAVAAKSMFAGSAAEPAQAAPMAVQGPKILVARKPLPVGTMIDAESLSLQPWPKELMSDAYYLEGTPDANQNQMAGMVVRNEITAGQPITRGSLVGPKDRGFLAAALGPGMRAVTVPVTVTSGVAGFVFPGDRVDMVLTQNVTGGGDGSPLKVSETIVRNLRVLATDQRIDKKDDSGKTEVKTFTTVTFEATPRIAEKIAVAQSVGTLSLSLRSIADNTAELERAVASGQVKLPAGATPAEERKMLLEIANRPIDTGTTFTTGGDVSRFQRRTVPGKPASERDRSSEASAFANSFGKAIAGAVNPGAGGGNAVVTGPAVRVVRGNSVTVVPVGGR